MNLKQQLMVVAVAVGMMGGPALCRAAETCAPWPDLAAHRVDGIPLSGYDAPAICNHWLWAQAGTGNNDGVLNMEDVRPGAKPQFNGTTLVSVNGQPLKPNPARADWWPNKVVRRATVEGIAFEGTVVAARERYALLNRLVASNTTAQAKSVKLEIAFVPNGGRHATVEAPAERTGRAGQEVCRFEERVLEPGATLTVRAVNAARGPLHLLCRRGLTSAVTRMFRPIWESRPPCWRWSGA